MTTLQQGPGLMPRNWLADQLRGYGLNQLADRANSPTSGLGIVADGVGGVANLLMQPVTSFQEMLSNPYQRGGTDDRFVGNAFDVAGGAMTGGLLAPKPRNTVGTFGGRLAKTADQEALARAEDMAGRGVQREQIWNDTGWFQGVDGKWRFEIDDSGAQVYGGEGYDLFQHGLFRRSYPQLTSIEGNVQRSDANRGRAQTRQAGDEWEARIAIEAPRETWRSVGLHELQHVGQDIENFAQGGSPSRFTPAEIAAERARMASATDDGWTSVGTYDPSISDQQIAMGLYNRLAGEVEARAVQKRLDMTAAERRARPPWMDYDVPEADQIVRLYAGGRPGAAAGAAVNALADNQPTGMVAYRGQPDAARLGKNDGTVWASSSPDLANVYAMTETARNPAGQAWAEKLTPSITPVEMRFKNPLVVGGDELATWDNLQHAGNTFTTDQLASFARRQGHDGLVVQNVLDGSRSIPQTSYAALDRGTVYSPLTGELLYAGGPAGATVGTLNSLLSGFGYPQPAPPPPADWTRNLRPGDI